MKNEGFDQLAYARRIRSAGRAIHIPEDDGEVRYIPSAALRVYLSSSLRGYRGSLFPISSSSYRGSPLMSNGSKIPK